MVEIVKCKTAVNDIQFALAIDKECNIYAVYRKEAYSSKHIIKKEKKLIDTKKAMQVMYQVQKHLFVDMQDFLTTNNNLYISEDKRALEALSCLKDINEDIYKQIEAEAETETEIEIIHLMTLSNKSEILKLANEAKKANDLSTIIALNANCNLSSYHFKELRNKIEEIYRELRAKCS